jgi:hypothetical protein
LGDQAGARAGTGRAVIWRCSEPSAYMTQIWPFVVKAMRRPKGENVGSAGWPGTWIWRRPEPFGLRSESRPSWLQRPS